MALAAGYSGSNYFIEIDGAVLPVSGFTPPAIERQELQQPLGPGGETKVKTGGMVVGLGSFTFPLSQTGPLADWVMATSAKNFVEKSIAVVTADQNMKAQRRVEFNGAVIMEVSFTPLDARNSKVPLAVTVKFQAETVRFAKASGQLSVAPGKATKNWLASNFTAGIPGIDGQYVTAFQIPTISTRVATESVGIRRLPTRHYAAFSLSEFRTTHAGRNFDQVQGLAFKTLQDGAVTDDEYADVTVDLLDTTLKTVLARFTLKYCAVKRFEWAPPATNSDQTIEVVNLDFTAEELAFERKLAAKP